MDDKDIEIARLQGQIEAYQDQLRSMSIELLRKQVADLQDAHRSTEAAVKANSVAFGRLKAEVAERIAKASTAFVELRDQVKSLSDNGAASG